MSTSTTPQGPVPAIGVPDSQDYPRLVYAAPYFTQVPLAELIEPAVLEATEALLPSLVPPYVQDAADTAVQQQAVLLAGSTMSGPLFLSGLPTQPSQAANMAYVDMMTATGQVPDVPPVPANEIWGRQTGQWTPIAADFLPLAGGQISGQLSVGGATTLNGQVTVPNGTLAAPGLQFAPADGTGFSRAANVLSIGVQGTLTASFFNNAAQFNSPVFMLNNRIQQVADATAATDALNLRTADARYGTGGPFLPLSGGSGSAMGGHIFMANHSVLDVAGINSFNYAPLPFGNPIQTAGYQFWPPGGTITFSGAGQPYIDINTNFGGSITGTGLISANRILTTNDTVAAPLNNSFAWWSVSGSVGYPIVWGGNTAYTANARVTQHGRIYLATTGGTSAASGGPTGTGSAITDGTVVWAYQSPNNTGDRVGIYAALTSVSEAGDVTAGRTGGPAYVSVGGTVQINYGQGGTNLTTAAAGGAFGANFLANLGAGCTNFGAIVGTEISVGCAAGSSVKNKIGLQLVQTSNDGVSATNGDDVGFLMANQAPQGTAPGWVTGLCFGSPNAAFPIKSTGTIIGAGTNSGSINAAYGIDLTAVTFSQASLRLPGFYVSGLGISDGAMNRLTILPGATSSADITFQQSGSAQFEFNGNLVTNGWFIGAPDGCTLSVGTTNTLRLNGGSQPEIQVIGSQKLFFLASGGFQFNGNFGLGVVPIPKQTITGSRAGNAALASFLAAMANYGFITDSTTA
jgi:hypothetical protein